MRRIFELCAAGAGLTRITKTLNEDGVPAPRPQQGRPAGWAPSYRAGGAAARRSTAAMIVWNQTPQARSLGPAAPARPARGGMDARAGAGPADRLRRPVGARRTRSSRERHGSSTRPRRSVALPRVAVPALRVCALCASAAAGSRRTRAEHGRSACSSTAARPTGSAAPAVCGNGLVGRMDAIDAEVLATLRDDVLRPAVDRTGDRAGARGAAPARQARAARAARDANSPTVDAERARSGRRHRAAASRTLDAPRGPAAGAAGAPRDADERGARPRRGDRRHASAARGLEARLRAKLADWRGLLTRNVESGRDVLRTLLVGPLRFTPVIDERRRGYRFAGAIALDRLVAGVIELTTLTGWRPQRDSNPRFSLERAASWASGRWGRVW